MIRRGQVEPPRPVYPPIRPAGGRTPAWRLAELAVEPYLRDPARAGEAVHAVVDALEARYVLVPRAAVVGGPEEDPPVGRHARELVPPYEPPPAEYEPTVRFVPAGSTGPADTDLIPWEQT